METFIKALGVQAEVILILAISFIILVVLLRKFLFRPLMGYLDRRNQEIQNTYTRIEEGQKELTRLKEQYQSELARIEKTAYEKIQEAIKQGLSAKMEIISEAHTQADKILRRATAEIEQEKLKAMVELKKEIVNLSLETTRKIIGQSMDETTHRELVDKFLMDLDKVRRT